MMMDQKASVRCTANDSRRRRFDYILGFWKGRESYYPDFFDLFTRGDQNTNRDHGTEDRGGQTPSPSPTWFDTNASTTCNFGPACPACPSLDDLVAPCDLDTDSDAPTVLGSVSSGFYAPAGDYSRQRGLHVRESVARWGGDVRVNPTPPPVATHSHADTTSEPDCVPPSPSLLVRPWMFRWRHLFLAVAVLCLGYILVSALVLIFLVSPVSAGGVRSSSSLALPRRGGGGGGGGGGGSSSEALGHYGGCRDACDWDCFKFLFN